MRLRIPVALPETLGPVKPGDRVALQVMYCPAGFKELDDIALAQAQITKAGDNYFPAFQPMLSNRLEFKANGGQ